MLGTGHFPYHPTSGNNPKVGYAILFYFFLNWRIIYYIYGFPGGSVGKEPTCNARDPDPIPGSGRSPGGGHGSPLQCSWLENPMNRVAWWATVHGVTKNRTQLSDSAHTHMYIYIFSYMYLFHIIFHYGLSQDIEYSSWQFPVLYRKTLLFIYRMCYFKRNTSAFYLTIFIWCPLIHY